MRRALAAASCGCVLGMLAASGTTQSTPRLQWTEIESPSEPFARSDPAMAYDMARKQVVMFGGYAGVYLNDTWVYDGAAWNRAFPATIPPNRARHAMAYDPLRQRVVMMGGTRGVSLHDAWEWDGNDWQQVSGGVSGFFGADGAASYDPTLGGVVYHANQTTKRWDGSTWTLLSTPSPQGGTNGGMVYDAASGGLLHVTGASTKRFRQADGWQTIATSTTLGRFAYAMAIDPFNARPVLHGGGNNLGIGSTAYNDDTWVWNGTEWSEVSVTGPPASRDAAMVFDVDRKVFVLFGGTQVNTGFTNDTWELSELPRPPADYRLIGQGCSGSLPSAPTMQPWALFNSVPVLGGDLILRVDGLPPNETVFGLLGISSTSWGALPLPFDLSALSMNGCSIYISINQTVALGTSDAQGIALWALPIPNVSILLGGVFYQQVLVTAPGANPYGLLWSNGGEAVIGAR